MRSHLVLLFKLLSLLALGAALSSCNLPQRVNGTPSTNLVHTAAAQTVAVELTQMAASALTPPVLVFTEMPMQTNLPAAVTPLPSAAPSTTSNLPCDRASFVDDITYPDNSPVAAGSLFTKTWRLKNTGACVWTAGYSLVFMRGDAMGAPASVSFTTGIVAPGETIDVSITLTAPTQLKTYQGHFMLRNADGMNFGIGEGGQGSFWVKVTTIPPDTATAFPTATTTATPAAAWQFDLLGYAPAAEWRNKNDQSVTWGEPADMTPGAVFQIDRIQLEDGRPYNKLLALIPQSVENGTIQGLFPAYTVGGSDHFRTIIGLAKTCQTGAKYHFQVKFIEDGSANVVLLGEWIKTCDGKLMFVDQSLNILSSKKVRFCWKATEKVLRGVISCIGLHREWNGRYVMIAQGVRKE